MWRFFEVALTHSRCSCNSFRSKPVCATCDDVDDDPYFSSYAHFGIHEEMLKVWKLISFIADFAQRLLRRLDTVFSYGFRYLLSGMAVLAFWFVNNLRVYQEIHAICSLFFWPVIHKTWLQHLFFDDFGVGSCWFDQQKSPKFLGRVGSSWRLICGFPPVYVCM